MRKFYTYLVIAWIGFIGNAQIVSIPDANFKAKLVTYGFATDLLGNSIRVDANYNNEIETSEALQVATLNLWHSNISNLSGIEYFTNLKELNFDENQVTSLTISALVNLRKLSCRENQLTTLDLGSLGNLQELTISRNLFTSIDVNNLLQLRLLECDQNQITTLNVSNLTLLEHLNLSGNTVSNLAVTTLSHLKYLEAAQNNLASINVNGLTALTHLGLGFNHLTTLDVSGLINLNLLGCYNNQLTSLDLNGLDLLVSLQAGSNQLTTLDLSNLTLLQELFCEDNLLTELDLSKCTSTLYSVYCQDNLLTKINIKNGYHEETFDFQNNPNLQYICSDDYQVSDIQNSIAEYNLTNCQVNTYCSFNPGGTFYTVSGNSHIDYDNNGCDTNDLNYQYLNLAVTDGSTSGNVISDSNGHYNLDLTAGTYSISPVIENPSYFTISPANLQVTFPSDVSPLEQNFCITPNGTHKDLEITLIPITIARPGFDSYYKLVYKNKGNFPQSGNITFRYYDDKTDFISSQPIAVNQSLGLLSWDYNNLLPFESREITIVLNINSPMETPPVNGGDILNFVSVIYPLSDDELAVDNTSALKQLVVNSFDPNDKTCLEGNIISPDKAGEYVHYLIRFENTGTANAENVVVKDVIDSTKYDLASLVPLDSSHSFITKISNVNQVEFIFEGINLPFDDANNDGYVAFKIKTKPTLVEGDTFSNTASIYFDYNFPVVTDPAITTITALNLRDFDFGSMFSLSPVPVKNFLTITPKQEVIINSISIYNSLGQLIQVNTKPNKIIDVSGLKTGSYFLKISSDMGSASSKFVKE